MHIEKQNLFSNMSFQRYYWRRNVCPKIGKDKKRSSFPLFAWFLTKEPPEVLIESFELKKGTTNINLERGRIKDGSGLQSPFPLMNEVYNQKVSVFIGTCTV